MEQIWFYILIAIVAFFYASVGHGGASGYLALMAMFGFAVNDMKSTALILNLFVSGSSFFYYFKKGFFKFDLFWPFALTSIPAAYFGALLPIQTNIYHTILGVFLIFAAVRFFINPQHFESHKTKQNLWLSLLIGVLIGFLSGLIGIGGGIVLSPIELLLGWANVKQSAAVSAIFIFVNSTSALLGYLVAGFSVANNWPFMVGVAFVAGLGGSYFGSSVIKSKVLTYFLAFVLVAASIKLIFVH